MVIGKKGSEKYYIIISLILGLMILGIGLFFIFNEFFTSDELQREACRQSVLVRASSPTIGSDYGSLGSFKDAFPLKCKTKVIEVEVSDVKNLDNIVAENIAECWAVFGNGDYDFSPPDSFGLRSTCVPCTRIHLTSDAKEELMKTSAKGVNIKDALALPMTNEYSYASYLENSGDQFPALNPANSGPFVLEGSNVFKVDWDAAGEKTQSNRLTGAKVRAWLSKVYLPEYFNTKDGDLIISYGTVIGQGGYTPYLFYFQSNQDPNPFEETNNFFLGSRFGASGASFCEDWDGIPA